MLRIRHFATVSELEAMSTENLEKYLDRQLELHMKYREQKYLVRHTKAKKILDKKNNYLNQ